MPVGRVRHVGFDAIDTGGNGSTRSHSHFINELRIDLLLDRRSRFFLCNQRVNLRERRGGDWRRGRDLLRSVVRAQLRHQRRGSDGENHADTSHDAPMADKRCPPLVTPTAHGCQPSRSDFRGEA
jgi:hypothetical protein